MGFSFDFTGERNVIVYQAEAGMVLDENIYRLLRSELMEEYILSFETENTSIDFFDFKLLRSAVFCLHNLFYIAL